MREDPSPAPLGTGQDVKVFPPHLQCPSWTPYPQGLEQKLLILTLLLIYVEGRALLGPLHANTQVVGAMSWQEPADTVGAGRKATLPLVNMRDSAFQLWQF